MKSVALSACCAACLFAAAAGAAGTVELTPYVGGRVVMSLADGRTAYTYAWPGVYFEAQFTGDAVDVKVNDDQNNLYLFVDGVHKLTLTRPKTATVALKDLGPGRHVVRLEKASETQSSTGTFEGFYVENAADALPPPQYGRFIEFIGDSLTVGYGDTARGTTCTVEDVRDTTDTSQAFAPMVAKHFAAAYRIDANSGKGIVRNYSDLEHGNTLPEYYKYALFDKSAPANDEGWSPDVIVVNLGTNDFSTQLAATEVWKTREELRTDYVKTYTAFVKALRAKHPAAHVILLVSDALDKEILDQVNLVAEALQADGEKDLEVLSYGGLEYLGCHGHPSLKDEKVLAQMLIDRIALLPKFAAAQPEGRPAAK